MAFDLSSAKPVGKSGFDLNSSKPVAAPVENYTGGGTAAAPVMGAVPSGGQVRNAAGDVASPGMGNSLIQGLANGATAGLIQPARAGIAVAADRVLNPTATTPLSFKDALNYARQDTQEAQAANPVAFGAGNVVGSVAGVGKLAAGGGVLKAAGASGLMAGTEKYLESEDATLGDAAQSGAIAGGLGVGAGVATKAAGSLFRAGQRKFNEAVLGKRINSWIAGEERGIAADLARLPKQFQTKTGQELDDALNARVILTKDPVAKRILDGREQIKFHEQQKAYIPNSTDDELQQFAAVASKANSNKLVKKYFAGPGVNKEEATLSSGLGDAVNLTAQGAVFGGPAGAKAGLIAGAGKIAHGVSGPALSLARTGLSSIPAVTAPGVNSLSRTAALATPALSYAPSPVAPRTLQESNQQLMDLLYGDKP